MEIISSSLGPAPCAIKRWLNINALTRSREAGYQQRHYNAAPQEGFRLDSDKRRGIKRLYASGGLKQYVFKDINIHGHLNPVKRLLLIVVSYISRAWICYLSVWYRLDGSGGAADRRGHSEVIRGGSLQHADRSTAFNNNYHDHSISGNKITFGDVAGVIVFTENITGE